MPEVYPEHLEFNGRRKIPTSEFKEEDRLFHGFTVNDMTDSGGIKTENVRFPDFSCNWSRFSNPEDIRFRKNGLTTDGCYAFSVETSRYNNIATPVHDPMQENGSENYAHVEVRELFEGEEVLFEPPKGRKKDNQKSKKRRFAYRINLANNSEILISPTA
ncbi:MAG: hypothetical protein A2487_15310 [Candidatus Raymondbacteria bacterium RifOxyC12_full_50_8]|uniref:Uncharacterized protein n=1 Tax=Candidatus Raymondbacteria bacterium RIFOXYD12_FULL_49_13 TaxID=1817890 RepID=A0A1F7FH97_UNCRA|nr:MAG: hypothetical protein A2248_05045 [Candidatus Raymondbacteria bacterium RIFOXYA2_FULL_49_16]OGJ94518.1 MAG: hypothetical protein A2487_15310 [Candidatus Raymondbacteria bacterium RifOxyC12_full_50_8]OGJ99270.1 MAG: hypothetical protein A2350_05345 [Candidatus Raymondbacteria bacterium RifOxyB12_full_50_8]OGK05862.1 MAG: hypothetical protein A2519_04220 [Candidatus Raymondbacteria bacterium RIFOXYD12_FULL_49_13]OGP43356.1 MAG: hypothetical protein A2324_02685 [Candidatus Raymondbacteria b